MHVSGQRLGHFRPSDVGNGVQGEAVVGLVHVVEVLADRVDCEAN